MSQKVTRLSRGPHPRLPCRPYMRSIVILLCIRCRTTIPQVRHLLKNKSSHQKNPQSLYQLAYDRNLTRVDVDCHFTNEGEAMSNSTSERNKTIVLEAFQALFNKRDYKAAERFWSPNYIQHSAHIHAGRDGLLGLIRSLPPTLKYEPGVVVAEGDFVILHGRFSGIGLPTNWIVADVVRLQDGILVEHWDVIQDE